MNFWLGSLISERGDDLYRMKGVIAIRDFPDTFVFQVGAAAPTKFLIAGRFESMGPCRRP